MHDCIASFQSQPNSKCAHLNYTAPLKKPNSARFVDFKDVRKAFESGIILFTHEVEMLVSVPNCPPDRVQQETSQTVDVGQWETGWKRIHHGWCQQDFKPSTSLLLTRKQLFSPLDDVSNRSCSSTTSTVHALPADASVQ